MRNKKTVFSGLLLILIIGNTLNAHAQQIDYARKVIQTLASPAFKGRGYVEKGDQLASAYIANEFKKFGLLPLNKGSYFQEFQLPVNTFPGIVEVKLNGTLLSTAVDYLVNASSPSVHGNFKVLLLHPQQINSEAQFREFIKDAADAFISIDNRSAANETAVEKERRRDLIEILANDSTLNFKGLLVFLNEKLTWTTLAYQSPRAVITVNKKELDPTQINQISVAVATHFNPAYKTRNVAAMVKGTSGIDSTLVVTAHYDHLGLLGKKVYFPGANDNASGVAMLLSFARHYAQHPPKYNMVFIAFSGEEIGLLGSKAYVEQPLLPLDKIKFLVNLDLAGTGEEGIKVVNGSIFKKNFDQLVQLNQKTHLLAKVESRGEACNSDHCRFYQRGVPSFFIYTQGGIQAYHDVYDRAETLPLTAFENYFQLLRQFFDCTL
ncbi:M28 family metallopeptidase [Pedobacter sp.]|uniref:M28 family metallopeptidase n=1 Tax=Pedobacter sp. TaxID=1411316 RepID=UPI003D7F991E